MIELLQKYGIFTNPDATNVTLYYKRFVTQICQIVFLINYFHYDPGDWVGTV